MRIAISTALFATLIAASALPSAGFAAPAFPPGAEPKVHGQPQIKPPVGLQQTLLGTVIDYGNLATTVGTGYTLIDQNTVACKENNCTITIDSNEQVGNAGATGNWFAVCPLIDGNFGPYGCPYAGEVPSDYGYAYARARTTFPVKRGIHTVQVYLYLSTASADSDAYDIQYAVYLP